MTDRRVPLTMLTIWLIATLLWWGLAFAPSSGPAPQWLETARQVCFGTLENGLPDTSGWMLLILGPLSFLLGFLVAWSEEVSSSIKYLAGRNAGRSALLVAGLLIGWEATWVVKKVKSGLEISNMTFEVQAGSELPEGYPVLNQPASDFDLIDQNGNRISPKSLEGRTILLTFAFAHCKTICPAIINQNAIVLRDLDGYPVELLIVTLDPWRDTPASLASMAKKWKLPPNAHVLSGSVPEVIRVLNNYKVPWQRDEKTGDVSHPALTYVIHPNGTISYAFSNVSGDWLIQAVKRIQSTLARN
jgi:protein SCO1/2